MSNNSSAAGVNDEISIGSVTWSKVLIGLILYLITAFTLFGNILVLVAVKIEKKLQTTFNYYIVNLAITDVLVAVTAMSFQATYVTLGYWPFGEILCSLWIFFDYGMTFVSVFTLILISIDRFWSVTWSLHYRNYHSKKKCIISIIGVWLFMLILWVPPWLLDRIRYSSPDICFWDPFLNKEFVFIIAVLGHHGPYFVMLFCYIHVAVFIRNRAKVDPTRKFPSVRSAQTSAEPSTSYKANSENSTKVSTLAVPVAREQCSINVSERRTASHDVSQSREQRAFTTLSYIMIGYAILWLPFHICFDVSIVDPYLVPEGVLNMAFWMAYFNSTINPLLYNLSSPDFRTTFKRILGIRR